MEITSDLINLNLEQEEFFLDSYFGSIYSKISKQNNNHGFYFSSIHKSL